MKSTETEALLGRQVAIITTLASDETPLCAHCGKPAKCVGAYESEENIGFACDDCCGHGNEDGWCVNLVRVKDGAR